MKWEPEAASFLARIAKFARERVAPGAAQRDRDEKIPRDLFRELGKIGLLGALLPPAEGGAGLDMRTLVAALRALAQHGRDASLSIALLPTFMLADFHLPRSGSAEQKRRYLPRLLSGDCLAALGFSELPHGANPKHLETRAEREGDGWVIEGKKAFVTNGPEADLFVVLAVTSREGDRKGFTAFLVERETPGLTIGERMPIPFVRAAPHCTLLLEGCAVPDVNRLGAPDGALAEISGATRTIEDLLGAGSFAGQMALVTELAAAHRRSEVPARADLAEALGELRIAAEAVRLRSERLAEAWDQGERGDAADAASEAFTATLLGGRGIAAGFGAALSRVLEGAPPAAGSDLERAVRDLAVGTIGGAANRARIRRLGERLAKRSGD